MGPTSKAPTSKGRGGDGRGREGRGREGRVCLVLKLPLATPLAEGEVIDAFPRNDDGLAEALLAAGTLQEILGGMPTFNTLAPGMATDANPLSAPQVEGTDETASYAAPDEPECDEALPAPPPRLREPRSLARVRRCTSAPVGKHAE